MKKSTGGTGGGLSRNRQTVDRNKLGGQIKTRWPKVWEHMSQDKWDDGDTRVVSTLLLVLDPDGLKACLNDRANACSLWATGMDLGEVLDALESMLGTDAPAWRARHKM